VIKNLPRTDSLFSISEPKHDTFTLVYLGAVSEERGSSDMLEALAILRRRSAPAARLDIVGPVDTAHLERLEDLARRLEVADAVRFHGYVPPREAWSIAARCHCGLAVLRAHANYVESYPTKMFEYMALGLPVVASNFPLYRSVVEGARCGLTVPASDPVALAAAIELLQTDAAARDRMGMNGRQAIREQYDWETQEPILLASYRQLLAN
jgi:glycosyltransferase involved in cell wall biosynthesis